MTSRSPIPLGGVGRPELQDLAALWPRPARRTLALQPHPHRQRAAVAQVVHVLEDGQIETAEEEQMAEAHEDIEALYVAVGDLRERVLAAREACRRHA